MRLVIHAGMHKTGSSSLQVALQNGVNPTYDYIKWRSPNHSGLYLLLFHPSARQHPSFSRKKRTASEFLLEREQARSMVIDQITSLKSDTAVFSAEAITGESAVCVKGMDNFFRPYFDSHLVIAYVRSPVSFMQSAFQQRVKGGLSYLRLDSLWPRYEYRFKKLDTTFGINAVNLLPFARSHFVNGSLTDDFAHHASIDICSVPSVYENKAMSLEATALLFAFNRHEQWSPSFKMLQGRSLHLLGDILGGIGSHALRFSPSLMAKTIDANIKDQKWIESRLQTSLVDSSHASSDAPCISSEADLLEIASDTVPELYARLCSMKLIAHPPAVKDLETAAHLFNNIVGLTKS